MKKNELHRMMVEMMKKNELHQMMAEMLMQDRQISADKRREKARSRDLAEQRQTNLINALIPLVPALMERLTPGRRTLGLDLASALSALNQSLTSDQLSKIREVLTADQQMMMVDATRMAGDILGADPFAAQGSEISPEDMADMADAVRRATTNAAQEEP